MLKSIRIKYHSIEILNVLVFLANKISYTWEWFYKVYEEVCTFDSTGKRVRFLDKWNLRTTLSWAFFGAHYPDLCVHEKPGRFVSGSIMTGDECTKHTVWPTIFLIFWISLFSDLSTSFRGTRCFWWIFWFISLDFQFYFWQVRIIKNQGHIS